MKKIISIFVLLFIFASQAFAWDGGKWDSENYINQLTVGDGGLTIGGTPSRVTFSNGVYLGGDTTSSLEFGITGGTYNENLLLNLDSAPNKVAITSDTGVDTISFGSINLTKTNSTIGAFPLIGNTLTGSATTYYMSVGAGSATSTESLLQTHAPFSGSISSLNAFVTTAPGSAASGKAWTVTLRVNSSDSTLTCQILETATSCSDTTHSVSVTKGDLLTFGFVAVSSPAANNGSGANIIMIPS